MHGLSLGITITFLIISFISLTVGFIDVCETNYLTLPFPGDRGLMGVTSRSGPTGNVPCILRLQGCSKCSIALHPEGPAWHLPPCPSSSYPQQYSLKECIPGCSYLFVFDSIYLNETLRFYDSSSWPVAQFKSISSAVFVGLCSHQTPPNITLAYTIDPNTVNLSGPRGQVRSPNFPNGYVQNGDVFTWVIKNLEFSKILVVFDDWHISPFVGEIFFDDGDNRRRPINGSMIRPIILSNKPEMTIIFSTGNHFLEDQNRYMGFKFTYTFYRNGESIPQIRTDCGRNYLINSGGVIDFQQVNSEIGLQYDCIWVIKKQPNFDKIYMKIIKFRTDEFSSHSNQEVEIRKGLTSDGEVMDKVYPNSHYKDPYFSETGFYIRFRGPLRPMDNLQIVFTSYRERGYSDCINQGMFYCGTQRCIPSDLKCDRFNHCGDNSDENNANCFSGGAGWSRSSNYTMTVSVIVPLVISVFLLVILCVLFFLIRRCHKARAQEFDRDVGIIPTISAGIGRRRRQRNRQARRPADFPPTYEEALENPPYEEPPLRCEHEVLKPPSYNEAIGQFENEAPNEEYVEEEDPPPEFSTIDRSRPNSYISPTANGEEIRPVNHTHSMSYSSESSTEIPGNRNVSHVNSPPYTVVPRERLRTSHRERSGEEEEYMERTPSQPKLDRPTENRSLHPTRAKNDMGQELERKRMNNQTEPAVMRRDKTSQEVEQLSHSKNTGKDRFRERHSLPDTSSRTESLSKAGKFHKDEKLWREGNQRRPKEEWRSRASDKSSNSLLFSEEHFTDRENRGIPNQAFKDFDQSSLNSPTRTTSASLANLSSLERWTDDKKGMAMSLQQLPTTHCVASSDMHASDRTDLPRRTLTANQRHSCTSASQEVIGNQQHLHPTNRNISLSVGNLPAHHHNLQHLNLEQNRPERAHNPSHRSVSLGDLNRRVYGQSARRQAHSQADLSNIQEERSPNSIVFACENEDVFV